MGRRFNEILAQNGHRVFEGCGRRVYGRNRPERNSLKNVEARAGAFRGNHDGIIQQRNVEISKWTKAGAK